MKGFSLIELVIIILITSILAVYVIYNWPSPILNVNAQAQQFANDIRFARSLSVTRGERYRIVRLSANSYTITNSAGTAITFPSGKNSVTLQTGITFGAWNNLPNNLIAFDSKGAPYINSTSPGTTFNTNTNYTILLNGNNATATVSVSPTTGRVVVS